MERNEALPMPNQNVNIREAPTSLKWLRKAIDITRSGLQGKLYLSRELASRGKRSSFLMLRQETFRFSK